MQKTLKSLATILGVAVLFALSPSFMSGAVAQDADGDGIVDGSDSSPNNPCLPNLVNTPTDPQASSNSYAVTNCSDLSVVKSGGTSNTTVQGGSCTTGQLAWNLAVTNAGPANATDVVVTDDPTNATVQSMAGPGCTGANTTGDVWACSITSVPISTVNITVCTN